MSGGTIGDRLDRARDRWRALRAWADDLQGELVQLPATLGTIRRAADNIDRVSTDLTDVATALNRVTKAMDSAGVVESMEVMGRSAEAMRGTVGRMEAANKAFEDAVTKLPGADLLKPWLRR